MNISKATRRWLCFALTLIPFVVLLIRTFTDNLGIDPFKTLIRESGEWAIRLLIISLAITPIMGIKYFAKSIISIYKKPIGLAAFFYALLHLLIFTNFELHFDIQELIIATAEKPYIFVGMSAFIILLILTITSIKKVIKIKIIGKNWVRIHQLVYLALILAVIHYMWSLKNLILDFWIYLILTIIFLGYRLVKYIKKAKPNMKFR